MDSVQTVSASVALGNYLNNPSASYSITDTSSNVSKVLDNLNAMSDQISTITLSDGAKAPLSLTFDQYNSNSDVLGKLTGAYSFAVTAVTIDDLLGLTTTTGTSLSFRDTHIGTVSIADSAESLSGAVFDQLQALLTAKKLGTVTVTDASSNLTLTASQLTADAGVLKILGGNYGLEVTGVTASTAATVAKTAKLVLMDISDTVANYVKNLDALQTIAATNKLGSVSFTDAGTGSSGPIVNIAAASFAKDLGAVKAIAQNVTLIVSGVTAANAASVLQTPINDINAVSQVSITDTSSNVSKVLDNLNAMSDQISTITLSDGAKAPLSLTFDQYNSNSDVLGKLTGAYSFAVTAVTIDDLLGLTTTTGTSLSFRDTHIGTVSIADSAESLSGAVDLPPSSDPVVMLV